MDPVQLDTFCITLSVKIKQSGKDSGMGYVQVQINDQTGNWQTVANVVNNSQRIEFELRSVKSRYPERRVRAIDEDGRLIDLI